MKVTVVLITTSIIFFALIYLSKSEAPIVNVTIDAKRPRIIEAPPHFYGFANTPEQYTSKARVTYLSVCKFNAADNSNLTLRYKWKIVDRNRPERPFEYVTGRCYLKWQAFKEGLFDINVIIYANSRPDTILAKGEKLSFIVRDIWIVAMGDSFASGQGNPDRSAKMMGAVPATWISGECCRSSKSWSYFTYRMVEETYPDYGIIFTYIACAGSTISEEILGRGVQHDKFGMKPQLDGVSEIQKYGSNYFWGKCMSHQGNETLCEGEQYFRKPDLLLLSIGGNDIGFSEIMFSILWGNSEPIFDEIPQKLVALKRLFDDLAAGISEKLNISRNRVIIPHYFDITRNERGEIDASCEGLFSATTTEFQRAQTEILSTLNRMISESNDRYGWTVVENVTKIFERHGFCSKESFIISIEDSFNRQGNHFGAFHPNEIAHYKVAGLVWEKVENLLDLHREELINSVSSN